jgi:hypothetical protein
MIRDLFSKGNTAIDVDRFPEKRPLLPRNGAPWKYLDPGLARLSTTYLLPVFTNISLKFFSEERIASWILQRPTKSGLPPSRRNQNG